MCTSEIGSRLIEATSENSGTEIVDIDRTFGYGTIWSRWCNEHGNVEPCNHGQSGIHSINQPDDDSADHLQEKYRNCPGH